jgi:hypothetical protein
MCSILKRGLAAQCDHEHPLKLDFESRRAGGADVYPRLRNDMADIIRLVPKSEFERARLIREARAIYDSIFPPDDVGGEQGDARPSQETQPGEKN